VTCFTCHRGSDRPRVISESADVYGEAPSEGPDEVVRPRPASSADQVLDKYVQAIGGASSWPAHQLCRQGKQRRIWPEGESAPLKSLPGSRSANTIIHTLDGDSTRTFDGRAVDRRRRTDRSRCSG